MPLRPVLTSASEDRRLEDQSGRGVLRFLFDERARGPAAYLFVAGKQKRNRPLRGQPPRDDRPQRFDEDRDAGFMSKIPGPWAQPSGVTRKGRRSSEPTGQTVSK